MPRSGKGRLSGSARKQINERRAQDAINGKTEGILFARVLKMVGADHATVAIHSKRGQREVRVIIPPTLSRRGATFIGIGFVVAVDFGKDFDPDKDEIRSSDGFKIMAILTPKQAYSLQKDGTIPDWMVQDVDKTGANEKKDAGYEFDYSEKNEEESDESGSDKDVPSFQRKAPIQEDEDVDVDDI